MAVILISYKDDSVAGFYAFDETILDESAIIILNAKDDNTYLPFQGHGRPMFSADDISQIEFSQHHEAISLLESLELIRFL